MKSISMRNSIGKTPFDWAALAGKSGMREMHKEYCKGVFVCGLMKREESCFPSLVVGLVEQAFWQLFRSLVEEKATT